MKKRRAGEPSGAYLYDALSDRVAADVIRRYSTSFTLASRLLSPPVRTDVVNLYAVVRIADEIVDGAADAAGEPPERVHDLLDSYEDAVLGAAERPFHTDPVLHAWAGTARRCRLDPDHMRAFFASMRSDLDPVVHDEESLAVYIHGSAEVIGLMCLDIFLTHDRWTRSAAELRWLREGASALGSAFQKINFLRDLGTDTTRLHRSYLGTDPNAGFARLLDDCVVELDTGAARIPALPRGARTGVAAATGLYRELTRRLREMPLNELTGPDPVRVSVPRTTKTLLAVKALKESIR